ncbi:hypothetical protein PAMP_016087 [Pampus punctatissimus]
MKAALHLFSSVTVTPGRSQYFDLKMSQCGSGWGSETSYTCVMKTVKLSDSGVYWCESKQRKSSNSVNITVMGKTLRSVSTLFEYERLSLSCGENSSGWQIRRSTAPSDKISNCGVEWGTLTDFGCTIQTAKRPDSAIYWCESAARQRSNSANITVHDLSPAEAPHVSLLRIIRYVVMFCPYCISTVLMVSLCQHKHTAPAAGRRPPVSMTTIPHHEEDDAVDPQSDDTNSERHFDLNRAIKSREIQCVQPDGEDRDSASTVGTKPFSDFVPSSHHQPEFYNLCCKTSGSVRASNLPQQLSDCDRRS